MSDIDFFKFEEKDYDFPFYNTEYPLSPIGLIALIIAFVVPIIIMFSNIDNGYYFGLIFLSLGLIGVGIASKGKFKSICKKLKKSDARLIVEMIILQAVFALTFSMIEIYVFGIHANPNPITDSYHSIYIYIQVIFDLFGEELFKLIGIFIFAYIVYKLTSNRKVSIGLGVFLSLTVFGLMHLPTYGNLIHSLIAIGYASIFTVYTYLKTKNIFVSYITHLIYDVACIILATLPF